MIMSKLDQDNQNRVVRRSGSPEILDSSWSPLTSNPGLRPVHRTPGVLQSSWCLWHSSLSASAGVLACSSGGTRPDRNSNHIINGGEKNAANPDNKSSSDAVLLRASDNKHQGYPVRLKMQRLRLYVCFKYLVTAPRVYFGLFWCICWQHYAKNQTDYRRKLQPQLWTEMCTTFWSRIFQRSV